MRVKFILLFFILVLVGYGCSRPAADKRQIIAKINNYEITQEEFIEEFQLSPNNRNDTVDSRKEFLNTLVNRKLILQDAQSKGLDRDKDFLKMVERFWEQSLLRLVLDRKSKEVAGTVIVTDKEIKTVYDKLKTDGKIDKSYEQSYGQLKWEILRAKETRMLGDWMNSLRNKSDIKLNLDLLKDKPENK